MQLFYHEMEQDTGLPTGSDDLTLCTVCEYSGNTNEGIKNAPEEYMAIPSPLLITLEIFRTFPI